MTNAPLLATALLAGVLAGCANSPPPNHYRNLSSSPYLRQSAPGEDRRTPFSYEVSGGISRYRTVRLLPVSVYVGSDHQFGVLTAADRGRLAAYADQQFRGALARRGILAEGSDHAAVELKITITGAQPSVPVLATASRITPAGFALSGLTAATGGEGRFSGVVIYAAEFRDGPSQKVLWAYVTKQYPNALDIVATIDPMEAARAGLRSGAEELARSVSGRLGRE